MTDGKSQSGIEKLEVLESTNDGFKIAEADLKMRGPGDVLGILQSGQGGLKFVDLLSDPDLIREARKRADTLIKNDPDLNNYPDLRGWLDLTEAPE